MGFHPNSNFLDADSDLDWWVEVAQSVAVPPLPTLVHNLPVKIVEIGKKKFNSKKKLESTELLPNCQHFEKNIDKGTTDPGVDYFNQ